MLSVSDFNTYTNNEFSGESEANVKFWIDVANSIQKGKGTDRLIAYLSAHLIVVNKEDSQTNVDGKGSNIIEQSLGEMKVKYADSVVNQLDNFFVRSSWGRLYILLFYRTRSSTVNKSKPIVMVV